MDVKFLIAGDRAVSVEFGSVISLEQKSVRWTKN